MAKIHVSLTHTFDNGESSTTETHCGSLSASEAAAIEQVVTKQVTESFLRMGAYNAIKRDPSFREILAGVSEVMGGKTPA